MSSHLKAIFLSLPCLLAGCMSLESDNIPEGPSEPHPGASHFVANPLVCADVLLNKEADIKAYYQGEAYLRMNNHSSISTDVYQNYVVEAVESLKFFHTVATTSLLVRPRLNLPLRPASIYNNVIWYDDIDPLAMHQVRARYPKALILDMTLQEDEAGQSTSLGYLSFEVKAIDPTDGVMIARFFHREAGAMGVEGSLINPVLNALHDWLYLSAGFTKEGKE